MTMNLNRRKIAGRGNTLERITVERSGERKGRSSVLANQKIEPRTRGRLQEIRMEIPRERSPASREPVVRRRAASTGNAHPLGVRLLEGGVVLAAGLSMFVKNGIGQITGWIREGRDLVSGVGGSGSRPWEREEVEEQEREEGIWHGEEESDNSAHLRVIGRPEGLTGLEEGHVSPIQESPLRAEVERTKVQRLDAEEEGLPDEQLEDQAGALRARVTDALRQG
ncbi:MAG: hypothetical protein HQL95_04075 [Magnetococcales bacterium]|nr:hypothetical protein [Magnetococcales bacterium]